MVVPYLHATETTLLLQVKKDLDRHEGFREFSYPDPLSKLFKSHPSLPWGFKPAREIAPPGVNLDDGKPWTVGFGFTQGVTADSRMSRIIAERLLETKILETNNVLGNALPTWYKESTMVTKSVLINMAFNLGIKGLLGFRNTLNYMKEKNYKQAAANMRHSLWYKQVKKRAEELARRIETQEISPEHKAPDKL
jgi:GH24 family phage-related lysozyme (muramidase)